MNAHDLYEAYKALDIRSYLPTITHSTDPADR